MSGVPPPPQIWPPSAAPAPLPFSPQGAIGQLIVGYSPLGEPILDPGGPGRLTLARGFAGDFNFASYLYQWYQDDDDCQAFVASYNALAQEYLNWFNQVQLPYYPGPLIVDGLLDWVAAGLYGMVRPLLPTGTSRSAGALGTFVLGTIPLGAVVIVGNVTYYSVDDDYFKRILTWHLYKGDGKYATIEWIKRRTMRFLTGANGIGGDTSQTYQVSVSFGVGDTATISLLGGRRSLAAESGALGTYPLGLSALPLGGSHTSVVAYPPLPGNTALFQSAVEQGILELPLSRQWTVEIINPTLAPT
jgi:hypothetical protein